MSCFLRIVDAFCVRNANGQNHRKFVMRFHRKWCCKEYVNWVCRGTRLFYSMIVSRLSFQEGSKPTTAFSRFLLSSNSIKQIKLIASPSTRLLLFYFVCIASPLQRFDLIERNFIRYCELTSELNEIEVEINQSVSLFLHRSLNFHRKSYHLSLKALRQRNWKAFNW